MKPRIYQDPKMRERRTAWSRSRGLAKFRGETWNLTWAEFLQFWRDPEIWERRGKTMQSLVLTRRDLSGPWDAENCCLITRHNQQLISGARRRGADTAAYYREAIYIDGE